MEQQRVVRRERRLEADAGGEGAGQRQHGAACRHRGPVGHDVDAVRPLGHGRDGGFQHDGVPELGGHGVGDLPDAPVELGVLVTTRDVHERLHSAGRADEEQPAQQGDLGQVAGETGPDRRLDQVAGQLGGHVRRREPSPDRLRVPLGGGAGIPWRVERDLLGHGTHASDGLAGAEQRHGVDARDVTPVPAYLAARGQHVVAVDEGRERAHTHLLRQRLEAVVVGPDEAAAHVHRDAVLRGLRPHAAAHPVACLEDGDGLARLRQTAGCRQARPGRRRRCRRRPPSVPLSPSWRPPLLSYVVHSGIMSDATVVRPRRLRPGGRWWEDGADRSPAGVGESLPREHSSGAPCPNS